MTAQSQKDPTTVQVSRSLHKRLTELKPYSASFNDLLEDMAAVYEEHEER